MADSFKSALDAEITEIEGELERDPRFLKLRELKQLRSRFYSQDGFGVGTPSPSTNGPGVVTVTPRIRRPVPDRDRILALSQAIIELSVEPVPTSEIYKDLGEQGITIPGEKPVNNLSAILSNSGLFTANGRRGWTMRKAGDPAGTPDESNEDDEGTPPPKEQSERQLMAHLAPVLKVPPSPPEDDDIPF